MLHLPRLPPRDGGPNQKQVKPPPRDGGPNQKQVKPPPRDGGPNQKQAALQLPVKEQPVKQGASNGSQQTAAQPVSRLRTDEGFHGDSSIPAQRLALQRSETPGLLITSSALQMI
ncbi:unnamed protein product [Lota lota]